jgi:hypothetical protein
VKWRSKVTAALRKDLYRSAKVVMAATVGMVMLVAVVVASARTAKVGRVVEQMVTSWSAIARVRSLCCALRMDDLFSELAPVGLFNSLGSAAPVRLGIADWRKGFVDVCCGYSGSAIVGICIGCCIGCCCCCEKSDMTFCGMGAKVFVGLKGCGV